MRAITLLAVPFLSLNILAQELTVIPAVDREGVEANAIHGFSSDGNYILTWIGQAKAGGDMRYDVYDIGSKQHVKTVHRPMPDQIQVIVTMVERGDAMYLITMDENASSKQMDINAQHIAMPGFEPIGDPRFLGSIDVQLSNYAYVPSYHPKLDFFPSASGNFLLMTHHQFHGKNSTISCWVLNEAMEVTQQAKITLSNASDLRTLFQGGMVTDNGEAFVMVQANYTDADKKGMGNRIYRVEKNEVTTIPISTPAGVEVLSAYMVPNENGLSVGGFYGQKKTNGGRFHAAMTTDHTGTLPVELIPFDEEALAFNHARVVAREDGGIFLIGNTVKEEGLAKMAMNISALGPEGKLEWSRMVPRKMGPMRMIKEGFVALESKGDLILLLPDTEENLENYNKGEVPKISMTNVGSMITLVGRFDASGNSTYSVLGAPGNTLLFDGMLIMPDRHSIVQHAAPKGSKENRNVAYAVVAFSE